MEELRQDKFAECQRPKYTGREDRDLLGHLFSPHDALAGMYESADPLSGCNGGQESFCVLQPVCQYSAGCHTNPVPCYFPSQRLECRRTPLWSLCDTEAYSDF